MISWIIVIAALVIIDQVTKLFAVHLLEPVGSVEVISGVLRFTYVENSGAAFGMLADKRWVFLVISSIAIIALLVYMWKFRPDSKFACMAMSMIVAGGIGNMIDRLFRSGMRSNGETYYYVVDFVDFCAFGELWQWVFNFADVCVCVGGGMLVLWLIVSTINEYKAEKLNKAAAGESCDTQEATKEDNTEDK